jgi:Flp pilus assembly protein TadD
MSPAVIFVVVSLLSPASPAAAESFKSWAARGAREEREKQPKAAFGSYSNALTLWKEGDGNGAKAKVLFARAALREKDGDAAGALKDWSEGLELDKKNPKAFHRRGVLRMKAGRAKSAIDDFYKAVALDFGFAQAYADRAAAYEDLGELGFAREDHKQACSLGVKASCARAQELAKKGAKTRPLPKADGPPPAPATDEPPATEPAPEPAAGDPPGEDAPKKKRAPPYRPRFKDCLGALDACLDAGKSFGSCVAAAPACEDAAKRGCCPQACLKAYRKAVNRDRSEAQAFREHFSPDSICGNPPKPSDEED